MNCACCRYRLSTIRSGVPQPTQSISDPTFTAYAIQANPPIHIIVENGKVALKGVVATPMESQVAEANVRTRVMAFDVTNDLKVEERG